MFKKHGGTPVGTRLKTVALVQCILQVLIAVVIAFVYGRNPRGDFNTLYFLGILIVAAIEIFLTTLIFYCIGDAAENAWNAVSGLEEIKQMLKKVYGDKLNTQVSTGMIMCPKCGVFNDALRETCKVCGTKLKRTETESES